MLDDSARLNLARTRFPDVRWYDEVDSTNQVAAGLVRQGAGEGLVVVADYQTAGRGRRDRSWEAPRGSSLLMSVVLRMSPPGGVHIVTGAVALAAIAACEEVAGVAPLIKWPNDLVVNRGKLGGILGEVVGGVAIVGLGLNVNWEGVGRPPPPGIALDELAGAPVDRAALLVALLRRLDERWAETTAVRDAEVLDEYRARSATVGHEVRVDLGSHTVEGRAVDITPDGRLVVEAANNSRRAITGGDVVHVRPIQSSC